MGPASAGEIVREVGVYGFMKPAMRIYGSPRVIGTDRLDAVEGPVMFAANHHSHADTSLHAGHPARPPPAKLAVAAGADYFFPNRIARLPRHCSSGRSRSSGPEAVEAVDRECRRRDRAGHNLLIYPEGGRSPDGWSREHRPGAAFVAKRTGAPVVPVYIDGTGTVLPKGQNWPTRSRTAVVFGNQLQMEPGEDARAFADRIQARINELADEFSHGWWEARKRAHADRVESLQGPEAGAWRRRWALGPKPSERSRNKDKRWPQR